MADFEESVSSMEPMIPSENQRELEDMAASLIEKSARMSGQLHPFILEKIGDIVRNMNCYYSNLIEDHNTLPFDIEKALKNDFSTDNKKRELQLEAKAHIEVQSLIEKSELNENIFDEKYIRWIHKEFYNRLPEEFLNIKKPDTKEMFKIIPGELRSSEVIVGRHIPISAKNIPQFLERFKTAYHFEKLSRIRQIIAVAAAHHRLLWIHPFYDGNGRVVRLLSHAAFIKSGTGNRLWSISRGLARNSQEYKNRLADADKPREGDLDGRGNLSQKYLTEFCKFFIQTAVDQVEYMSEMLDISKLLERIELFSTELIKKKIILKGSNLLLREALYKGKIARKSISTITGYSGRQAREITSTLIKQELLNSDTPYGDIYIQFPVKVLNAYFPNLYPPQALPL